MTRKATPAQFEVRAKDECANCGRPKATHWVLNFADGPFVTGQTLVCPTSIYRESRRELAKAAKGTR